MKRALERMRCSSDGSGSTRGLARWTVEGEEGKRGWREGVWVCRLRCGSGWAEEDGRPGRQHDIRAVLTSKVDRDSK
jgi:hypothetical protein